MDPSALPPLWLVWSENPSDSGKVHSDVRRRWLEGDADIAAGMTAVACLAEAGRCSAWLPLISMLNALQFPASIVDSSTARWPPSGKALGHQQLYDHGCPDTLPFLCRELLLEEPGHWHALAALMNENFALRRRMFGDAVLGAQNLCMVELAASVGGA